MHNSYLQLYCDTGILGLIALILGTVVFIRLIIKVLQLSQRNSVNWIEIGVIGGIISGAIFAVFDVTTSVTYVTNSGYIYLVLPLFWLGAAFITVVENKLSLARKNT